MQRRIERSRRGSTLLAGLALAGLVLGVGPALAQLEQAKTCSHEGKVYQAGEKLMISGKLMVCDGASGSWVPAKS